MTKRADATCNLIDALTGAVVVESPVATSESVLFERQFSSVADCLNEGAFDETALRQVLYESQPEEATLFAGYEAYMLDCTNDPAPEAETLEDRGYSRAGKGKPVTVGHRYSWLARCGDWNRSWCLPQDVQRVKTEQTDSEVAVEQVKRLDKQSENKKVVVADSLYGNAHFLAVFLLVTTVVGLVRLRSNRVLYGRPEPKPAGSRGRKRKHGEKFKLKEPSRPAEQERLFRWLKQTVRVQAWTALHFRQLADLEGMVLSITFLNEDGTSRYKTPIYLFWTGDWNVPIEELARMYLCRFAIEHMFRFLKQHLGLRCNRSPHLHNRQQWMWICAIAFYQLNLLRPLVADKRAPWRPAKKHGKPVPMTPRQVQRNALPILVELDTPASAPRPAGKGHGRCHGHRPQPRKRFKPVKKGKKSRRKAKK